MADATQRLDDGTEIATVMRRFYPLVLEQAAADVQDQLGVDLAFNLNNPAVLQTLDKLATQVRDVADTTKDEIRTLTGQATQEGWSPTELARKIREHGVTASKTRSELISITESATAYTQGSLLAYHESGVVQGTQWIATDPCPICAALDGKTAALGESFDDGLDGPPAHPRCRCALIPILKTGPQAAPDAPPAAAPPVDATPFDSLDEARTWAQQNFADWMGRLTPDQQTALADYKGYTYRALNRALRRGTDLAESLQTTQTHLDSAIAAGRLDRGIVTYRGMASQYFEDNWDTLVGTTITDAGFVSTSQNTAVANRFLRYARDDGREGFMTEIRLPEGTHAAYLGRQEDEILLGRGHTFRVVSTHEDDSGFGWSTKRVVMELVP